MATVQAGNNAVKRAAANPALELLERLGYVVRGALYAVMGILALGIALSFGGGQTTDLTGSLRFLIGNPFGKLVLVAFAIGLAAYSVWGFVRAIYDPLHRGSDASGFIARWDDDTKKLERRLFVQRISNHECTRINTKKISRKAAKTPRLRGNPE